MKWDSQTVISLITALGLGGIIQAIIDYFRNRRKVDSDAERTEAETSLVYLRAVIEGLNADRVRLQQELDTERADKAIMRRRIRELEDEVDAVRISARDTQRMCDILASRLKEFVDDVGGIEDEERTS